MAAPPVIRARGLRKRYGDVTAVDGLDLEVARGECLGLLGPNGAGKTTTIEILEGLKRPDEGEVEILGLRWGQDAAALRERIGVQLQETHLPPKLRVEEVLRAFSCLYERSRPSAELLELAGLADKRRALVEQLSGGQKQRLSLGCALAGRPEVLFLDEPTTGLDPQARRKVWETVEEFLGAGGTALLTTHNMEEAEALSDRVLVIDHGRALAQGAPSELVASLRAEVILDVLVTDAQGGPHSLDDQILRALPDVRSVTRVDGRVHLAANGFQRALPALVEALSSRDLRLADLSVHRPTLEDVFVSLTGRELREP